MKYILLTISLLFLFPTLHNAQSNLWSDSSAEVLDKGRLEWQLFGKKKYGIGNDMELSAQPLLFFVSPHMALKKRWKKESNLKMASKHKIGYPTLLLRMLSREGTGGVLPKTSSIPNIITLKNEFIVGNDIAEKYYYSARIGLELALTFGEADFPQIDFPFIYNRTSVYHNKIMPYLGFNFGGTIIPKLDFEIGITAFTNGFGGFVFEDKATIFWKQSNRFGIKAGVTSAFGQYAYGNDFRLMPVIDFVFGFGGTKVSE